MLAKRHSAIRSLRAPASRVIHALAVLVLLTGIAQAGSRYFYCPLMQVVLTASCCDHDERTSDQQELLHVRARRGELFSQWSTLPAGGTLELQY